VSRPLLTDFSREGIEEWLEELEEEDEEVMDGDGGPSAG